MELAALQAVHGADDVALHDPGHQQLVDLAAAGELEEDVAAEQLGSQAVGVTLRCHAGGPDDYGAGLALELRLCLPRGYPATATGGEPSRVCCSVSVTVSGGGGSRGAWRPAGREWCDGLAAAAERLVEAAAAEGRPALSDVMEHLRAAAEDALAEQRRRQQGGDSGGSGGAGPAPSPSPAGGGDDGLQLLLLRLDHMHNRALYCRTIGSWIRELRITGRLVFQGGLILILLEGDAEALRQYLCKERMMTVVGQKAHRQQPQPQSSPLPQPQPQSRAQLQCSQPKQSPRELRPPGGRGAGPMVADRGGEQERERAFADFRCPVRRGATLGFPYRIKTSAVLRKNAVVQRRAWRQNLCLLGLPLVFCILLLVLQRLVNTQLGASDRYRCGCKCTECCDWLPAQDGSNASVWTCYQATDDRPCSPYARCSARDRTQCGAQYSTYSQIAFCDVRHPATWPAVLQVPLEEYRPQQAAEVEAAGGSRTGGPPPQGADVNEPPAVIVPYTGGDAARAASLSSRLVPAGGDRGIGGRILRDLRELQQTLQRRNSTGNGTRGGSGSGSNSNPLLIALSAAITGSTAAAAAGAGAAAANLTSGFVDLCDPRVDVAALFSGAGTGGSAAAAMSAAPNGSVAAAAAARRGNSATLSSQQMSDAASLLTQILSDYDFLLGTATDATYTNLLEPSLISGSPVLGGSRSGSGGSSNGAGGGGGGHLFGGGGSGGVEFIVDPGQALPLYHLSRNCSALGPTDTLVLDQLGCALRRGLGLPQLTRPGAQAIERELFCGWAGARCGDGGGRAGGPGLAAGGSDGGSDRSGGGGASGARRMLLQSVQTSTGNGAVAAAGRDGAAGAAVSAGAGANGDGDGGTADGGVAEERRIVQYPSAVYRWGGSGGPTGLQLTLWVNNSDVEASFAPRVQRWPAAINAAANAWLAEAAAAVRRQPWVARLAGVKGFPTRGSPLRLDLASLMGPLFFMWVMQLLLPTYVYALVSERESGAQLLMRQQGLRPAPAALAAYVWFAVLYGTFMAVFVGFGAGIGLNVFTKTAVGVQLVFYVVWGHAMVAWAFWFAAIWGDTGTATLAATTTVVLTGLVANMIVAQFVTAGPYWLSTLLEAFPSFALFRGLWEMSQYAFLADANGGQGLTWPRLRDPDNGMAVAWALLAGVTVWCVWCAWYWGQVFGPDDLGVRCHPFFFLGLTLEPDDPRGWDWFTPAAARARVHRAIARLRARAGAPAPAAAEPSFAAAGAAAAAEPDADADGGSDAAEGPDVRAERERVERLWRRMAQAGPRAGDGDGAAAAADPGEGQGDGDDDDDDDGGPPALLLRDVRKVFPGPVLGGRPHVALRGMSLAVGRRETLGLLGPNGAGKTTTLRIMQGILEPSSGAVTVCGLDLRTRAPEVARRVGICPQHDVLWPSMTGREHVRLFGRIKARAGGRSGKGPAWPGGGWDITPSTTSGAESYNDIITFALTFVVGSPQVLYLDEPSTGLDPASRRLLWQAVLRAKRRCAVVLTTHSMEEAEALCDRLGVVVGGRLRALGSPQQLLADHSSYLTLSLTVTPSPSADEEAERFVRDRISAGAKQVYRLNGCHSYEVPRGDIGLAELFRIMTAAVHAAAPMQSAGAMAGANGSGGGAGGSGERWLAGAVEGGGRRLAVVDWAVSSATLESVFVRIAREAGAVVEAGGAA
ncbi:hypothetical protein GPECTOR_4g666 [Gonium pectorale]|uniref:ABC transporter domain-containing protein n=1 Tax=Gonium pectorale TaxID=33097 RepID=A0A150GXQ0_GONPE|nr:hypothetical protein GPECTOR_4g666 [Gonium pectorale]|eukprot:KXZ54601.1 hypothetical protein GPECTOR_4g666 [Gonium pectorale]